MKKLISSRQAQIAPKQHQSPCSDCPWRRDSLPGWLGSMSPDEWIKAAHGEAIIDCHVLKCDEEDHHQCAGAAIYRANVAKAPRSPGALRLAPDTETVFRWFDEFKKHHEGK